MKALGWIGLILALLLLIVAAVFGGLWFGKQSAPTPSPTPAHTVTAHRFGVVAWEKLRTGDCVIGFTNAWQDTLTVVSCDADHSAQLLLRDTVQDAPAEFPGQKALATTVGKLCASPALFDPTAAKAYSELLIEIAYPQTDAEWAQAPRYDCFVAAPTGQFLTTNLMPSAAPATPAG